MKPLLVGNAQAFWGDATGAAARLAVGAPELNYLTLDYLAEVSMSILARQMQRDPALGYARDFLAVVESLIPFWNAGRRLRVITNAGGLNPRACAKACSTLLRDRGCGGLKVAVVTGDDVLPIIVGDLAGQSHVAAGFPPPPLFPGEGWGGGANESEFSSLKDPLPASPGVPGEGKASGRARHPIAPGDLARQGVSGVYAHLETGESISAVADRLITANAYLGAVPLVEALRGAADLVITGRVADPSLTVAPAIAHFDWPLDDYQRIAGATIAGHLIECGTQVTGGICTDWLEIPDPANIGFPIAQIHADGSCVITKPAGSGGRVSEQTVKEQLLYEIGDPANYLSPDATVSFLGLKVIDEANDRVRISGAIGRAPPGQYKVSATYRAGFRASGTLTIMGRDAAIKAKRCGEIVRQRLARAGRQPKRFLAECIGGETETVLRISAFDENREIVEHFTRELAPLITSGPQGVTGYGEGRPAVHEVVGYWPTLIDRAAVWPIVEMIE